MYREVTTPAPVNPRQNPSFTPTPLSRFVPQARVVSVFHVCFGIFGAGVASDEGSVWSVRGGLESGAEGQIRGSGGEKRVIDDDDR